MKLENEITVLVNCSYNELHQQLINNNFKIKEEYNMCDNYMIKSNINITSMDKLEVLKNCVLVRNIIGIKKVLLYKYKKYAQNGDILEQGKVECPINDINKAINFMQAIDYKKLFNIYDKCIIYINDKCELAVQLVNDKYIFIEMESESNSKDIEKMKNTLDSYNLSYVRGNYFVKKAEIILEEVINNTYKEV